MFTWISHLYSNRHGDFYDYLGVGRLVLKYLPSYVPPPPSSQHFGGVDTQNWLDEMHGGSADPCTNNPVQECRWPATWTRTTWPET